MRFAWEILTPNKNVKVLESLPLKSTEYLLSPVRLRLEEQGHQSDLLMVVGAGPGKATIVASSGTVSSHPVGISVVENFQIQPPLVGLPFCGHAHLRLATKRGTPVALPNKAYSFAIPALARQSLLVESSGKVASLAKSPVQVSLTVSDTRTDDNEETARICVGEPTGLRIVPDTNYPVVGSVVTVRVLAASKDCPHVPHLFLSQEVNVGVSFIGIESGFADKDTSVGAKSTTFEITVPQAAGKTLTVTANLTGVTQGSVCSWNATGGAVKAEQIKIQTVSPIALGVKSVLIPESQEYVAVSVSGGSGQFSVTSAFKSGSTCQASVIVTDKKAAVVVTGPGCAGTVTVADSMNARNKADLDIVVASADTVPQFALSENLTLVEAFIGFDQVFAFGLNALTDVGAMYNCSSLIKSVAVADPSIASVSFSPKKSTPGCGRMTVTPLKSGATDIVIDSSVSAAATTFPLLVHSPFSIRPSIPTFNTTARIGVNASLMFAVGGGSLARLPAGEEVVKLSHPWVADVATNRDDNTFKITCKAVGKSTAAIAHSANSSTPFECVDVKGVRVISDAAPAATGSNIFVTCGHDESHQLRLVAVSDSGAKLDNFSYSVVQWENTSASDVPDLTHTIPPLTCDTELVLTPSVTLHPTHRVLTTTISVKARDTVRAAIGPQLSVNRPVFLPCEFSPESTISHYGIQFLGGSGDYWLEGGVAALGRAATASTPKGVIAVGDPGLYAVQVPARECLVENRFTVKDTRLEGPGAELALRLSPVTGVVVTVAQVNPTEEPIAVVVEDDWTEIRLTVQFPDATFDSVDDAKWFAVTQRLFAWTVVAGDTTGVSQKVEKGKLFIKFGSSSSGRLAVQIESPNVVIPNATLEVIVVKRATLRGPAAWTLMPRAQHDVEVVGMTNDGEVEFSFEWTGPVTVTPSSSVNTRTVTALETTGAGAVMLIAKTKRGRTVYSEQLSVVVTIPTGVRIGSGESLTVPRNADVVLTVNFVDVNHVEFFPPHQVTVCEAKWSLYGSVAGQSTMVKFSQPGAVPVQVLVRCPGGILKDSSITVHVVESARRIAPLANLVTGAEYTGLRWPGRAGATTPDQEGQETVTLSESEIGAVLYRHVSFAQLVSTDPQPPMQPMRTETVVVGERRTVAHVDLFDRIGEKLVFPDNFQITVGCTRPGIVAVTANHDSVEVTGKSTGCAIVYAHLNGRLVGLKHVCAKWPVVPTASEGGLVVAPGGVFVIAAAMDLTTISVAPPTDIKMEEIETVRMFSNSTAHVTLAKSMSVESFAVGRNVSQISFQSPLGGVWRSERESGLLVSHLRAGVATVHARSSGKLTLGDVSVPVTVERVGSIRVLNNAVMALKQNTEHRIGFVPISVSGKKFSYSSFIDHRWSPSCVVDRPDLVDAAVVGLGDGSLVCQLTPLSRPHSGTSRIFATITVGDHAHTVTVDVEPHFHVVTGPYSVPVSQAIPVSTESADFQIKHLRDGACAVSTRHQHVSVSSVNATNHFTVTRTAPLGTPRAAVSVTCGSQFFDFAVDFLDTSKGDPFVYPFEGAGSMSTVGLVWWLLSLVAKMVASVAAIAGVAMLFQRKPQLVKNFRGSVVGTKPAQFSPHPHPERDSFLGTPVSVVRKSSRWSSIAE